MKKNEIIKNNAIVEKAMEEMNSYFCGNIRKWRREDLQYTCHIYGKPLLHCSAEVFETPQYDILVSYATIVAFIDKDKRTSYDVLRKTYGYTATSAMHISKFANMYKLKERYRWYPL